MQRYKSGVYGFKAKAWKRQRQLKLFVQLFISNLVQFVVDAR